MKPKLFAKQRCTALLLALCLLMTLLPFAGAANTGTIVLTIDKPTITANGTSTAIDVQGTVPVIMGKGYTMLPIRAIVEAMGGTISWDNATRTVTMTVGSNTVKLTIDSTTAYINGKAQKMDIAPVIKNSRTLVWVRTVEYFTDVNVTWNNTARTVTIDYPILSSTAQSDQIQLTITNQASGYIYQSLYLAESGTGSYGGNLLTSTLYLNNSLTVSVPKGTRWDIKAVDIYNNTRIYSGIDLGASEKTCAVTLTTGALYEVTPDTKTVTANLSDVTLTFQNATGATISELYIAPTGTYTWEDEFLGSSKLYDGESAKGILSYDDTVRRYDVRAVFRDGTISIYRAIDLYGVDRRATIYLRENSTFSRVLDSDGTDADEIIIGIANKSGKTVTKVQLREEGETSWDSNRLLSNALESGDTEYFILEPDGIATWDFRISYESGDVETFKAVTLAGVKTNLLLTLKGNANYTYEPEASVPTLASTLKLAIENESGYTITGLYYSKASDDSWSSDILDDNLLSGDTVSCNLRTSEAYLWDFKVEFKNGKTKVFENISFLGAKNTALLTIDSTTTCTRTLNAAAKTKRTLYILNRNSTDVTKVQASIYREDDWQTLSTARTEKGEVTTEEISLSDDELWDFKVTMKDGTTYTTSKNNISDADALLLEVRASGSVRLTTDPDLSDLTDLFTLYIENKTGTVIDRLNVARADTADWSSNLLSEKLYKNDEDKMERFDISDYKKSDYCIDIRVYDEDGGRTTYSDIDLSDAKLSATITLYANGKYTVDCD